MLIRLTNKMYFFYMVTFLSICTYSISLSKSILMQNMIPGSIDTHQHIASNSNFREAADSLIALMDRVGIQKSLVMPPPEAAEGQEGAHYDYTALLNAVHANPARLGIVGGGGILNRQIHASVLSGQTPDSTELAKFESDARAIAQAGVSGFGEMTILHISYAKSHPFLEMQGDHPMFLRLADVAAEFNIPIDIHLELVTEKTILPPWYRIHAPDHNPDSLNENLAGFEALLAKNRDTKIVWQHVGWDNVGYMTTTQLRTMLNIHSNLFMGLKMLNKPGPIQVEANRPFDNQGNLHQDWLQLFMDFPDRFVLIILAGYGIGNYSHQ